MSLPQQQITDSPDAAQALALVHSWCAASEAGDLDALLLLMTDDILFLTPANPPMTRADFIAAFRSMQGKVRIACHPNVQEITIEGPLAILRNQLVVEIHPLAGGETIRHAGEVLSVLRRAADGRWRLWRDANLLTKSAYSDESNGLSTDSFPVSIGPR